jgi:hypothetical protein
MNGGKILRGKNRKYLKKEICPINGNTNNRFTVFAFPVNVSTFRKIRDTNIRGPMKISKIKS